MEEGSIEQVGGLQFIDCVFHYVHFFLGQRIRPFFLKKDTMIQYILTMFEKYVSP